MRHYDPLLAVVVTLICTFSITLAFHDLVPLSSSEYVAAQSPSPPGNMHKLPMQRIQQSRKGGGLRTGSIKFQAEETVHA